ncbi:MAG: T6SS immunity protein Tli4 family protein [Geobacteraceae bacterium]|nr:T6SS immunity protein Tli4 family protein [Geobacteraceae bacterium]
MSIVKQINVLLIAILVSTACYLVHGCDKSTNTVKGVIMPMKTYYIGRFSIAVPAVMKLDERTSKLRFAEITEVVWPHNMSNEQARDTEWDKFMSEIKRLKPPKGKNNVIIKINEFPGVSKWAKGVYYYYADFRSIDGKWALLMDTGSVGVWFKGNSVVEKENANHYLEQNIEASAKAYIYANNQLPKTLPKGDWFYLEKGAINRPYRSQEESSARFDGHSLNLVLDIKMEMDMDYYRETMGLIEGTKGMIDEASREPGISFSIVRLGKREVAGMKGEESILRASDNGKKSLLFAWEFNGKEDSGEYPTTTIEMEAPDGKLDEKIAIWDAVLDSMKPMFERKK